MSSKKQYWLVQLSVGMATGVIYWVTKGFFMGILFFLCQLFFAWLLGKLLR